MSDAPERIWIDPSCWEIFSREPSSLLPLYPDEDDEGLVAFVRADLAALSPSTEALRYALEFAKERIEAYDATSDPDCDCQPCPECGEMPEDCADDCAQTCQCSRCDHCSNVEAIASLDAALAQLAPEGAVETLREPTDAEVYNAAVAWCGEKGRETFQDDIEYFRYNWRSLPGLEKYVRSRNTSVSHMAAAPEGAGGGREARKHVGRCLDCGVPLDGEHFYWCPDAPSAAPEGRESGEEAT